MKKNNLLLFPLLLVLYELATYLSNDAYLPALPKIMQDLATNDHLTQLTLTAWFLGAAALQLVLGPIADRFGRRPVLLSGGLVFVLATLACALAPNIEILLISRFVQGATIGSMIVAGYATIHELFAHEKAILTIAWMVSITVLAPACGPLFGAAILHVLSWRWIFGILAIWVGFLISALFFKMPETGSKAKCHRIKLKKILQQYKRILGNADYLKSSLSFCFLFAAIIAWITAGPFLIISTFHESAFAFGLYQVLVFGSYILGTRLVKPMMRKYKTAYLIKVGLAVAFCGSLLSLITWFLPQALFIFIFSMMIVAVGGGFCSPTLNRVAIEASAEPMGARMAIYSSLVSIFGFFGSAFISTIYNGTLISLGGMLVVFCGGAFLLKGFK